MYDLHETINSKIPVTFMADSKDMVKLKKVIKQLKKKDKSANISKVIRYCIKEGLKSYKEVN